MIRLVALGLGIVVAVLSAVPGARGQAPDKSAASQSIWRPAGEATVPPGDTAAPIPLHTQEARYQGYFNQVRPA